MGYPIGPGDEICPANSLGYTCTRTMAPMHMFHLDPHGDWWSYYPNDDMEFHDPSRYKATGYTLIHDPILPRIAPPKCCGGRPAGHQGECWPVGGVHP